MINLDNNTEKPSFQYSIGDILVLTVVVSIYVSFLIRTPIEHSDLFHLIVVSIAGTTLFGILPIAHRLMKGSRTIEFGQVSKFWLALVVVVAPCFWLTISALMFTPSWKGTKGFGWYFYLFDGAAGLTLWPLFVYGAFHFHRTLYLSPLLRRELRHAFACCLSNTLISLLYVCACTSLNFVPGRMGLLFVIAPLGSTLCYGLYSVLLWRAFRAAPIKSYDQTKSTDLWLLLYAWILSFGAKIAFAMTSYRNLPDHPPEGCFVVTAATRGHPKWVRTWFDNRRKHIVNRQLLTMWQFEAYLRRYLPTFHRQLRWVYNRIGPKLAAMIRFRWQASLAYLCLKPIEYLASVANFCLTLCGLSLDD